MQTVWKGSIAFGMVSIPVRLVSATEEKDITLRQVHAADGGRIKYKRFCTVDGQEVQYSDIAKGYELPDGDLVVLTDEDFANLPMASTKKVEVLTFADDSQINPVALSRAYYADPTGDPKPYLLLHDTLVATGKVAIVKMALRQKERLAVVRPQDGALVVHTMLWPDEVRSPELGFDRDAVGVRPQELQMATTYVEAFDEEFDPSAYHDDYRAALQEIVDAKVAGREMKRPLEAAEESNVVDLMDALRASIAAAKGEGADAGQPEPAVKPRSGKAKAAQQPAATSTAKRGAAKTARKPAAAKSSAKSTAKKTTSKTTAKKSTAKAPAKKSSKSSTASRRTA